jgi:hypothetical protein
MPHSRDSIEPVFLALLYQGLVAIFSLLAVSVRQPIRLEEAQPKNTG